MIFRSHSWSEVLSVESEVIAVPGEILDMTRIDEPQTFGGNQSVDCSFSSGEHCSIVRECNAALIKKSIQVCRQQQSVVFVQTLFGCFTQ